MTRQDRFALTLHPLPPCGRGVSAAGGRGEGPSVILSGDNARAGNQRLPRRRQSASGGNLGWGEPPVSQTEVSGGAAATKNLGLPSRGPRFVLRRTQTPPP